MPEPELTGNIDDMVPFDSPEASATETPDAPETAPQGDAAEPETAGASGKPSEETEGGEEPEPETISEHYGQWPDWFKNTFREFKAEKREFQQREAEYVSAVQEAEGKAAAIEQEARDLLGQAETAYSTAIQERDQFASQIAAYETLVDDLTKQAAAATCATCGAEAGVRLSRDGSLAFQRAAVQRDTKQWFEQTYGPKLAAFEKWQAQQEQTTQARQAEEEQERIHSAYATEQWSKLKPIMDAANLPERERERLVNEFGATPHSRDRSGRLIPQTPIEVFAKGYIAQWRKDMAAYTGRKQAVAEQTRAMPRGGTGRKPVSPNGMPEKIGGMAGAEAFLRKTLKGTGRSQ